MCVLVKSETEFFFYLHYIHSHNSTGCRQRDNGSSWNTVTCPVASGEGPLSADISLCVIHGSDTSQPFLCGHQSSWE